jgi:hypothetical protein
MWFEVKLAVHWLLETAAFSGDNLWIRMRVRFSNFLNLGFECLNCWKRGNNTFMQVAGSSDVAVLTHEVALHLTISKKKQGKEVGQHLFFWLWGTY